MKEIINNIISYDNNYDYDFLNYIYNFINGYAIPK